MLRLPVGPVPLAVLAAILLVLWFVGRRRWPVLTVGIVAALAVSVIGLLALGLFAERHQGAYRPARIENGRLIPGELQ